MNESDKKSLIEFGRAAGFGLSVFASIIALMGIYNGCGISSFYGFVGTINFAVEVVFFVKWYKKWFKKEEQKKEEQKEDK